MNLQKYFSLNIHQTDLVSPTNQTFCLLCRVHRNLLVHIPPKKVKTVQNTTFIWFYFTQMTLQLLTMEKRPECFNQFKKKWICKETILTSIYYIKYSRGCFGKIWIRKFTYVIFHIFYQIIFSVLLLDDEVILTVTHWTHHRLFLARRFHPENQMIGCFYLIQKNRCRNIDIVFSGLGIKYWITNSIGTHWWTK